MLGNSSLISKQNTLILKGGGILLMLFHHLFFNTWSKAYYDDIYIHGIGIVNQLGGFCKLCVAVFVFVSGYGLTVSTPKDKKLKDFYWHRFKKLYLNYWFVWLLLVPVGIFVFGRTFTDVYVEHVELRCFLDFFGLLKIFNIDGYNPTWWFYSCIIVLYLFFPLINKYILRTPYLILAFSVTIGLMGFVPGVNVITGVLFSFIIGMFVARMPVDWISDTKIWQILLSLALLSAWRLTRTCPIHIADGLLCTGMALLVYKLPLNNWIGRVFEELGKHSMNIFLTHTFIYYYWFRDYIYISRNPIIIFLLLVISSYLLSVFLEWLKQRIGFYKL